MHQAMIYTLTHILTVYVLTCSRYFSGPAHSTGLVMSPTWLFAIKHGWFDGVNISRFHCIYMCVCVCVCGGGGG